MQHAPIATTPEATGTAASVAAAVAAACTTIAAAAARAAAPTTLPTRRDATVFEPQGGMLNRARDLQKKLSLIHI